ncbi:hypothetical protein AG1IA_03365 [Rhizoctonia solani AG-1 IA]|uniref:Uncharacterized protein n=1 Tax=Thanatephorus cucumeris (strain AG1-IA) TaxID=983506 RepID=L8X0P0_THACA|nr:hypothetical protein AG1IA_03365 [Rhizoctonia solani AG-1 IA]
MDSMYASRVAKTQGLTAFVVVAGIWTALEVFCEGRPIFPTCPLEPGTFPEGLGAEPVSPTVTVIKWSTVFVLTCVTTEVMTEGVAVSQTDESALVEMPPVGTIEEVTFEAALTSSAIVDVEGVPGTVTVEVRLTSLVTVATLAEATVVGVIDVIFTPESKKGVEMHKQRFQVVPALERLVGRQKASNPVANESEKENVDATAQQAG